MSHSSGLRHEGSGRSAPQGQGRALASPGDLALWLTSRRARQLPGLDLSSGLLPAGWRLRLASPVWHAIWSRDPERLRRLKLVIMPSDIAGLDPGESLALLADQLARLGAGPALPDWLKPPLGRAKARLSARIARLD